MIKILYLTTGNYILGKTWHGLSPDMVLFADDWGCSSVEKLLIDVICNSSGRTSNGLAAEFYKRNQIVFPVSIDEFQIIRE